MVMNDQVTSPEAFNWCELSRRGVALHQDTYILDAGLEAGLDLPYTCRGGICGCAQQPSPLTNNGQLRGSRQPRNWGVTVPWGTAAIQTS